MLKPAMLKRLIPAGVVGAVLAASFIVGPGIVGTFASCGSGTLTANPASPHTGGGIVVLTATGACGGYGGGGGYGYGANIPTFRFWELDPGSRWSMVQDYSTSNKFNWNTTGLANGDYNLEVDIKSFDEPNSIGYDLVVHLIYHIGPPPCANAGLAVNPASGTGHTGGSVVMTGSSTGCPNPVYRFWIQDPGSRWSMSQDYSATTTHTWGPVGTYHVGSYNMEVDVRDSSENVSYDVVKNITYSLVGCTGATIVGAPASPQVTGAGDVTLTATATCPGTAEFRFWIMDAGSRWSMVQDFSSKTTYTWAKGNQRMGVAHIEVDVRDVGSLDTYEFATQGQTYTYT